jgi:hypothetical protein
VAGCAGLQAITLSEKYSDQKKMYNIRSTNELRSAISILEEEAEEKKKLLAEELNALYQNFSPVKVVKDVFSEVVNSEDFRSNLLTATLGIFVLCRQV